MIFISEKELEYIPVYLEFNILSIYDEKKYIVQLKKKIDTSYFAFLKTVQFLY